MQDVFQKPQLWKFIVSTYAFTSTPEMMFGLYLLYYFRVFERQIGSNKYSVSIIDHILLFDQISIINVESCICLIIQYRVVNIRKIC